MRYKEQSSNLSLCASYISSQEVFFFVCHSAGDTLYYKFYLEDYDPDLASHWGYKFTVTPGTRDSFETGHTILEAVLSSSVAR